MKNPLTPAGIEPATYRFVAQLLNHCATAVPTMKMVVPHLSPHLYETSLNLYHSKQHHISQGSTHRSHCSKNFKFHIYTTQITQVASFRRFMSLHS